MPGVEWPSFKPIAQPKGSENKDNNDTPLNDLQKAILGLTHELAKGLKNVGELIDEMNVGEALEYMRVILDSLDGP